MKLTVFQSDQGDCLLLTAGETRILIDGGMTGSFNEHVAPALGALRAAGQKLDVIYLSHIDSDHIRGVLQLLEDEIEWRVHEFQVESGNEGHREPTCPRPPEVGEVWHNGFRQLVEENVGEIGDLLAASARVLEGSADPGLRERASARRELETSVPEAIELSHRLGSEQLGIPLNESFGGELILRREGAQPLDLGPLKLTLLGPAAEDVERLRALWDKWLREERVQLQELQERMSRDVEDLGAGNLADFRADLDAQASELADRTQVTVPNLASLMFLVEEGGRRLLLTGDGHARDIEKGLEAAGALDGEGRIHIEVLKVQHHGSEHNVDPEFCRRVSADHYVFCGNGAHHNPDLGRLEQLLDSRLGSGENRNTNPRAQGPFEVWINSSSAATTVPANKEHMLAVERIVSETAARSDGRMSFQFLREAPSFELEV